MPRRRPVMTPTRVLVLAATAALVVLAVPVSEAQDVGGTGDTGWWSQRLGATAKADDGIEVAWVAEAPQSVAAVEVVVPAAEGEVLLVFEEIGGFSMDRGRIDLCRTTEDWEPANPGAFADAPSVECADVPPELGRDGTALEWTGSLGELLVGATPGQTVGIALLPRGVEPAEGLPVTTPFQVDLAGATLRVLDSGVPTTAPAVTGPVVTDPVVDPGVGGPGFTTPDLGTGGFDTGPIPPEPATAPPTTAAISEGDDFVALGPVDGTSGPGRPWWRLALLTPISLVGGVGAALARRNLLGSAT